jgi:hypothetical protein
MTVPDVRLDPVDAAELAELLQFLRDWLATDNSLMDASLARFVGRRGYDLTELCAEISRFVFLLGADDGDQLFGGE